MRELLLVRYGEIFLKGQNRPYFMRTLVKNIRESVKCLHADVWLHDGRIFVYGFEDMNQCIEIVRNVFGVHSVCPAIEMEKDDFDAITRQAIAMMEGIQGTFKVSARRSDKLYPLDSPQINERIGTAILRQRSGLKVDVHHPEHVMNVEIRDKAYLYVKVVPAVGGMPYGTNGKACLLLSGGIDSPVAGFMIAKRGVTISCVHFHSYPYTSDFAKEKVLDLARLLARYTGQIRVYVVPFTEIQMQIHEKCPQDYTTLIMRRFMMRLSEKVAEREGAQALITGESVGQVASQTMEALGTTDAVVTRPVFRPVIGFDKQEIIEVAERIGTFKTSSLPYEDCCTVFTPRHPVTHPKVDKIAKAEEVLDAETLIQAAMDGIETVVVHGSDPLVVEN
ncbi:MAG: tRNA 4-thiouridine(8) synthase ThiI [Clostridia bacterium]|nr:tRNA 4-thiouridine(8) synthase ThiI [Clostridia bacterium]